MFKRAFWLVTGAGFGFGSSYWVNRAVKRTVARYAPERVRRDATATLRGLGGDVRAALADGRAASVEREAQLRAELGTRPPRERPAHR